MVKGCVPGVNGECFVVYVPSDRTQAPLDVSKLSIVPTRENASCRSSNSSSQAAHRQLGSDVTVDTYVYLMAAYAMGEKWADAVHLARAEVNGFGFKGSGTFSL